MVVCHISIAGGGVGAEALPLKCGPILKGCSKIVRSCFLSVSGCVCWFQDRTSTITAALLFGEAPTCQVQVFV